MTAVQVEQGCIFVNAIWVSAEAPTVRIYEADLRAKHAEIHTLSNTEVHLRRGSQTTHYEETDPPNKLTTIRFPVPEGWMLHAEVSRYSLHVFTYKPLENGEFIFEGG